MPEPFFSVVIPTKNRPSVVGIAVESALLQTFRSLEIILVDNSDDDATRVTAESFSDERLRYVRTGGLSMPDNWEAGIKYARGEYILFLEDKQALKLNALEKLSLMVEKKKPRLVTWPQELFHIDRLVKFAGTGEVRELTSDSVLELFLNNSGEAYQNVFPVAHHSAIHKDVFALARMSPIGRACCPVSPDISIAFFGLFFSETILYVDEPFSILTTAMAGNGSSSIIKGPLFQAFFRELGVNEDYFYEYVPIKTMLLVGSIYNDYMRFRAKIGGRFMKHDLNLANYFYCCAQNINMARTLGADCSAEQRAWNDAYGEQPLHVRHQIDVMRAERSRRVEAPGTMKTHCFLKNVGKLLHLGQMKRRLLRRKTPKIEIYGNPIEYLKRNPIPGHVGVYHE